MSKVLDVGATMVQGHAGAVIACLARCMAPDENPDRLLSFQPESERVRFLQLANEMMICPIYEELIHNLITALLHAAL